MKKKIAILGSTGFIGRCLLDILSKEKHKFDIQLLTANKNYNLLFKQAKKFNVKNLIISDNETFKKIDNIKLNNKINIYNNFSNFNKIFNKKIDYTMNSIVGIDGLQPALNIIKFTKHIAIANKESIICGWNLIKKDLKKYNTKFIPIDSEHFSIWHSLNSNLSHVDTVYLTASGGPFFKKKLKDLSNIKVSEALMHPTWKMGKKISVDSATLINKVFEIIEAKKLFELSYSNLKIIIHPTSYVHSIIKFKNGLINIVAHETTMKIPIANSLNMKNCELIQNNRINFNKINHLSLSKPNSRNYPLIKLLNILPKNDSLFETVLVTANDYLVKLFIEGKIKYTEIIMIMLKLNDINELTKYKLKYPRNLKMILTTKNKTEYCLNKLLNISDD